MKKQIIISLLFTLICCTGKAQWMRIGPYTNYISSLFAKDHSVFVSSGYEDASIYRSDSIGNNWIKCDTGLVFQAWTSLGDDIFAAGQDGIYSSVNNGQSWQAINGSPKRVQSFSVSEDTIWAGADNYPDSVLLFYSPDTGKTWTPSGVPIPFGINSFDALLRKDYVLYAGTHNGVYISEDNGLHWNHWNTGGFLYSISCIAAVNPNTILAGSDMALFISNDNGQTWNVDTASSTFHHYSDFVMYGSRIFAATFDDGVFVSYDDGQTWSSWLNGLPSYNHVSDIVIVDTMLFAACGAYGLYTSSVNQNSWVSVNKGMDISLEVSSVLTNDTVIYAGSNDAGIYISKDKGNTWTNYNEGLSCSEITGFIIDSNIAYVTCNSGWVDVDSSGTGWTQLWATSPSWTPVYCIAKCNHEIFVGTFNRGVYRYFNNSWVQTNATKFSDVYAMQTIGQKLYVGTSSGMFTSDNAGSSWVPVAGLSNYRVNGLYFDGSTIYANQLLDGISVSVDSGKTWHARNNGVTDPGHIWYQSFASVGDSVFLANDHEIFLSTNKGDTWNRVFTGFPDDMAINSLSANSTTLFAATSNTVWQCSIDKITISPDTIPIPVEPHQLVVYPNPSSGGFNLFYEGHMIDKVTMYNMLGEIILEENHDQPSNSFYIKTHVSRGMYFIKVKAGTEYIIKPVVILR